jgi:hypothetical protein
MIFPPRPALALRIGITGTRNLDPARVGALSAQLDVLLKSAKQLVLDLSRTNSAVASAYLQPPRPTFRFLSPLARGADRLAAEAALRSGYTLHVPMPFRQADYEKDFDAPEDLDGFRVLLSQANDGIMELDGDRGPNINRAYEAVGRYVVRHCDVMIAIWDGRPGGGQGGTASIVNYAAVTGVPVWWLHPNGDREPSWIADIQDLRDPALVSPPAETSLSDYITMLVRPPPPSQRHSHGAIRRIARLRQQSTISPETEHFADVRRKRRWEWNAYTWLIRSTSGLSPPWTPPRTPVDPTALYWFDRYEPADARAGDYAQRYRSTYVWVFALATLALTFATLASMHPSSAWPRAKMEDLSGFFITVELLALLLILGIVALCIRRDWHEHSVEYRLLTELYRNQQVLAPLGWSLPATQVRGFATGDGPDPYRGSWVGWLFAAEQRASPFPVGDFGQAGQGAQHSTMLEELIDEQLSYHKDRAATADAAGRFLERWGERIFVAVLFCVAIKIFLIWYLEWHDLGLLFGFFAIVLPGVSAAFVGIRAYAELQLLAEESRHMASELERARKRVTRLNPTRPLSSQDLGAEATFVALLMLQDIQGWARLFRIKGMEAG